MEEQKIEEHSSTEKSIEDVQEESSEEEIPTIKKFIIKFMDVLLKFPYTLKKIYAKIKEIINNIRLYIKILQSESFKKAFSLCKDQLFKIAYHFKPTKLKGYLHIGFSDPSTTAQIFSMYGILYPLIGNNITVVPELDQQILEGNLHMKGKLRIIHVLIAAAKIYFNRDIKRLLRVFKKKKQQDFGKDSVNGRS